MKIQTKAQDTFINDTKTWCEKMDSLNEKELENQSKTAKEYVKLSTDHTGTKTIKFDPIGGVAKQEVTQDSKNRALEWKDKGNKAFGAKKFELAINYYSKAILEDPTDPVFYANRAMARLKLDCFEDTIKDCNKAIQLDSLYTKAYLRRAVAYQKRNKFDEARADFEFVLKLEPDNKSVKEDLKKNSELQNQQTATEKPSQPNKSQPEKSQPEKFRTEKSPPPEKFQPQKFRTGKPPQPEKPQTQKLPTPKPPVPSSPVTKATNLKRETQVSGQKQTEISGKSPMQKPKKGVKAQIQVQTEEEYQKLMQYVATIQPVEVPTQPPSSMFEFENNWRNLLEAKDKYVYFRVINPTKYREIFKSSMTSELLAEIIKMLKIFYLDGHQDTAGTYSVLDNLTKLDRFDILVMFLMDEEKQALKNIFEHLEHKTQSFPNLGKLKKIFSVD